MDTQTRHALKQDRFVEATASSLGWLQDHRRNAIIASVAAVVLVAAVLAGVMIYHSRLSKAEALYGQAMDIYNTPLAQPGQEIPPGQKTYPTAAARAKAANPMFVQAANKYGWFKVGKNAGYFAGLTYLDMGQTASAEKDLKSAVDSHDSGLEALAKMALAGLYRQTGRDDQAVDLYKQVIKHPTITVPAAAAQLELAGLYEVKNPAEAKKIYAQLKDHDKDTVAGQIAAQKLGGGAE
ncbi:MAG TPA: tetratricopeptide repeat protein [Acidobacteriaceae bacterium]|nr:tetratricopeptide repeat protein [Acidobacteriaceae bacterium]